MKVLVVLACLAAACGGQVSAERAEKRWPDIGCPPSHELRDGRCTVRELYVPGGTFVMGAGFCQESGINKSPPDFECLLADPPHSVAVPPFWVDATLYSYADMPDGLSASMGMPYYDDGCPSREIECAPRLAYAPALTGLGGLPPEPPNDSSGLDWQCGQHGKRAMREAEWEWLATWGGSRSYPWGEGQPSCLRGYIDSVRCQVENPVEWSAEYTLSKVASYPPSAEGVYDLTGNLGEWVLPSAEAYTGGYTPLVAKFPACPTGEDVCAPWVLGVRGGAVDDPPLRYAGAFRGTNWSVDGQARPSAFRCVRPAE